MLIQSIIGRRRDSGRENLACDKLRLLPENERLVQIVNYLLESKDLNECSRIDVSLRLANRTLESKQSFFALLDLAMTKSDPSTMQFWVKWICPKIGLDCLICFLARQAPEHPKEVEYAIYWLKQRYLKKYMTKKSMELFTYLINVQKNLNTGGVPKAPIK